MNKLQAHYEVSNLLNQSILKFGLHIVCLPILAVMFETVIIGRFIQFLDSFKVGIVACELFDISPLSYLAYSTLDHVEAH